MNVATLTSRAARFWPERIAVVDHDGVEYTYEDVEQRSSRLAHVLGEAGIGSNDVVAVLIGNGIEWFDITLALLKLGAIRTYINPRHTGAEIAHQLQDSTAKALIVSPEHLSSVDARDLERLSLVIETGDGYEGSLERADPTLRIANVSDGHPAEIRYTSGTTGRPKGAVNSHSAWRALVLGYIPHLGFSPDDVFLHTGPLTHLTGTFCLPMFTVGGKQVIRKRFDADEVVRTVVNANITASVMVPTMMYMLFDSLVQSNSKTPSLRMLIYGGAPMSVHRLELGLSLLGPVFVQLYGMSEVLGGMSFLDHEEHVPHDPRLSSCGRPSMLGELIVAGDDGQETEAGVVGEILMRGPTRLLEYWGRPDATASSIDRIGWFHSGDMAYTDHKGYVYIVDRKADMIISGGLNVYPAEVEHTLMEHPAIAEVAVVAVPDPKWGEAVKAVVRCVPGRHVEPKDLLSWAKSRMAGYKVPKSVDYAIEELPKNPTGKLLRRALREPYWADTERQVG